MPMGRSVVVGEPEVVKEDLGLRPRVVKDQRRLVLLDLLDDRGDRVFRAAAGPGRTFLRHEHRDVGVRAGIGVEDVAGVGVAGEAAGDAGGILDRGREADAAQPRGHGLHAAEGQHQLIAALGFGQRVNFVDDDPLHAGEHARRILVGGQQGEAFRRRQQDMRRVGALAFFLRGGGVAGAVLDPDRKAHIGNGCRQVAADVGGQRLERRNVEGMQAPV